MKALLLLALVGCGSYSTYRSTNIVPAGKTEWLFGAQMAGASVPGRGGAPLPEFAVAARRGLSERLEVQLNGTLLPIEQLTTGSIELAGKLRIGSIGRWSLAVGAAAGYRLLQSGGAIIEGVQIAVPLIGGVELGRHQLVFSITGGYQRYYSSGARPVGVPFIGDSVGFLWQLGKRWALLPEAGVAYTPTGNFMSEDSRLFHVGVAVLWTR
ncbi:hypothetical protein BH11MYX3_BH11MYX3_06180 [soil metagenome]